MGQRHRRAGTVFSQINERKICYLCAQPGADSRDHIVPSSLFSPPRPSNLVTLPAHFACQSKFSKSEDYLRNILAGMADDGSDPSVPCEAVNKAFARNVGLSRGVLKGLRRAEPVLSPGGIHIGTSPAFIFTPELFFPALEKMIRALVYHDSGEFLPNGAKIQWRQYNCANPDELSPALESRSRKSLSCDRVFESGSIKGSEFRWWFVRFYKRFTFSALFPESVLVNTSGAPMRTLPSA
jgi:hypothetical protein